MKIDALNALFQAQNPTGWVSRSRKGYMTVVFKKNGKRYEYHSSVYALAERLELIPTIDVRTESRRIVECLRQGQDRIISIAGLGDTIRALHEPHVAEDPHDGSDEYDRALSEYFIDDSPESLAWSCTITPVETCALFDHQQCQIGYKTLEKTCHENI